MKFEEYQPTCETCGMPLTHGYVTGSCGVNWNYETKAWDHESQWEEDAERAYLYCENDHEQTEWLVREVKP